jgi:flagellar protein FliO/FliZ
VTITTVLLSMLAIILALGFVLAMAWGTIFLLKKWQDRQNKTLDEEGTDWSIRFLRSMPLGQRERVALIEVRGETLLVGITGASMSVLSRWAKDAEPSAIEKAYARAEAEADTGLSLEGRGSDGLGHLPSPPGKKK